MTREDPETKEPSSTIIQRIAWWAAFTCVVAVGFAVTWWLRRPGPPVPVALDNTRYHVEIRGDEPTVGPPEAAITIVEFVDFGCLHCEAAAQPLKDLVSNNDDVRLVVKHFPLDAASRTPLLAWAAHKQGRFWPIHDWLLRQRGDASSLEAHATELRIDMAALNQTASSQEARESVDADRKAGTDIGVSVAPTFVVNGYQYIGSFTDDQWEEILEMERRRP